MQCQEKNINRRAEPPTQSGRKYKTLCMCCVVKSSATRNKHKKQNTMDDSRVESEQSSTLARNSEDIVISLLEQRQDSGNPWVTSGNPQTQDSESGQGTPRDAGGIPSTNHPSIIEKSCFNSTYLKVFIIFFLRIIISAIDLLIAFWFLNREEYITCGSIIVFVIGTITLKVVLTLCRRPKNCCCCATDEKNACCFRQSAEDQVGDSIYVYNFASTRVVLHSALILLNGTFYLTQLATIAICYILTIYSAVELFFSQRLGGAQDYTWKDRLKVALLVTLILTPQLISLGAIGAYQKFGTVIYGVAAASCSWLSLYLIFVRNNETFIRSGFNGHDHNDNLTIGKAREIVRKTAFRSWITPFTLRSTKEGNEFFMYSSALPILWISITLLITLINSIFNYTYLEATPIFKCTNVYDISDIINRFTIVYYEKHSTFFSMMELCRNRYCKKVLNICSLYYNFSPSSIFLLTLKMFLLFSFIPLSYLDSIASKF